MDPKLFRTVQIILVKHQSFWMSPIHFGRVQIILVRSKLKFIYSEKATKFCENSPLLLSSVVPVKNKVEISQDFVAFAEYMNFINIGPEKSNLNLTKMIWTQPKQIGPI